MIFKLALKKNIFSCVFIFLLYFSDWFRIQKESKIILFDDKSCQNRKSLARKMKRNKRNRNDLYFKNRKETLKKYHSKGNKTKELIITKQK